MTVETKITCNGCGNDLTTTGYAEDYLLVLTLQKKRHWGGATFDMSVEPPLDRDKHFCDLNCLKTWLATT